MDGCSVSFWSVLLSLAYTIDVDVVGSSVQRLVVHSLVCRSSVGRHLSHSLEATMAPPVGSHIVNLVYEYEGVSRKCNIVRIHLVSTAQVPPPRLKKLTRPFELHRESGLYKDSPISTFSCVAVPLWTSTPYLLFTDLWRL